MTTGDMFTRWLKNWDYILKQQKKKIALISDNCSSHPKDVNLTNIELFFLPPNTTSLMYPLDQGIIKVWKGFYRSKLNRRIIAALDTDGNMSATDVVKTVSLLDVLHMACDAWKKVKVSTIINCFKKAGFLAEEAEGMPEIKEEEGATYPDWFEDILELENELPTSGELSNAELLSAVTDQGLEEEESEEKEEAEEVARLTMKEKIQMVDLLRCYITGFWRRDEDCKLFSD